MRIHQVVTVAPGEITYRDISCSCTATECQCDNTHNFSFGVQQKKPAQPQAHKSKDDKIQWGPHLIDQWCALKYDGKIYPGVIQEGAGEVHAPYRSQPFLLATER